MAPLFTGFRFGFSGGIVPLNIGDAYEGGFFAGYISHTDNGIATHGLIVAPAASGYNGQGTLQWKIVNTATAGTSSQFNGSANSANMNNATHPAAQYCEGLTIGGYSDWYLPARLELDIAYVNLKPSTSSNDTGYGINQYSVPESTVTRTAGAPARTSIAAFQTGGAEAFVAADHWSSTEGNSVASWELFFTNGSQFGALKDTNAYVRAFRKFAL